MANYLLTDTDLTAVANAIRAKGGTSSPLEWPNGYISAIQAIPTPTPPLEIVSWSSGTDAQIAALIQAAHNGDIDLQQDAGWAVGDTREISLSAFTAGGNVSVPAQTADIVISQFGDYMSCGSVMQFDFKNSLSVGMRMNSSGNTTGGYGASEMKTVTLPAMVNALPSWLKDMLIEFSVLSAINTTPTIDTVTGNKLALRSTIEVKQNDTFAIQGEGSQVPYYTVAGIKKVRKGGSASSESDTKWWLRSLPNTSSWTPTCFAAVNNTEIGYSTSANTARCISPFGCL